MGAAQRNLADAQIAGTCAETRFDVSYKAIMQAALAALMANGYRPDTNRPGYHMTVIQSLPLTVALKPARAMVLDTLRRKRNLSDYSGADIDDVSVGACTSQAKQLVHDVKAWLAAAHPELAHNK